MIGDKTFWPAFPDGSKSCARYLASLAFKSPRWYSVADKIYKKASRHDLISDCKIRQERKRGRYIKLV